MLKLLVIAAACAGVAAAGACGDAKDAPVRGAVAGALTGSGSSAPADAAAGAPAGWRRQDLSKLPHPLAASVLVPPGAEVASTTERRSDLDGLPLDVPIATISGGGGPAFRLSSGADLGGLPTTSAAEFAENARRDRPFEVAARVDAPSGAWVVVYRWGSNNCFVRGWSPGARLLCTGAESRAPCDQLTARLDICTSIEPSGPPLAIATSPAAMFPKLEPRAAPVVVAVIRAIVRDDRPALLAATGPRLRVHGKSLTRAALRGLLADDTLARTFDIDCRPPDSTTSACLWNLEGDPRPDEASLLAHDGYGVVPRLRFTRAGDGAWTLAEVGTVDVGEP